ncbi:MAG: hypothetical protein QF724_11230, partial [Planctomycetota bacterium]|nr:hypothetical protein [Planctomycetota bacterium]
MTPPKKKLSKPTSAPAVQEPDTLKSALAALPEADLPELYRFWTGKQNGRVPADRKRITDQVLATLGEQAKLGSRLDELGKRLGLLLDVHLAAPRYERGRGDLVASKPLAHLGNFDLEAGLAALLRRGLLITSRLRTVDGFDDSAHRVPSEIGDAILRLRRARRRGVFDMVTLRGHLEARYDDPARAAQASPGRVRQMYKMYANEAAAVARVERLPEGLRHLIEKTTLEFGGLLPRAFFDRMETELPHWNGRRWGKILRDSLVGTVETLELGRYGLKHNDETLIVFNEVALGWFRRVAVPSDPDRPFDEASLGVDLASNLSRFLAYIIDHNVRFTIKGEIFKTTEKRILQDLIPNPGRELERAEVLSFIYRFARDQGFIESTGERTFALTRAGRDWEPLQLEEKLQVLLDHILESSDPGGNPLHQQHMRHIFLRLLKRLEPGTWYDLMYLPFLARNNYICNLDELGLAEAFADGQAGTPRSGAEDLQRLAWNLVGWVRKRLYLLGLVDLGYDRSQRPVAMRLTRTGARILGLVEGPEPSPLLGSLVVTADFEVVLFPSGPGAPGAEGGEEAELVHDLDRFCDREKIGHLLHFRISENTVQRGLREGLALERMVAILEGNARTPV